VGLYINPPNMSKEDFLEKFCKKVNPDDILHFMFMNNEFIPICVVQNPNFKAIGILYNKRECYRWLEDRQDDHREHTYYLVPQSAFTPEIVGFTISLVMSYQAEHDYAE